MQMIPPLASWLISPYRIVHCTPAVYASLTESKDVNRRRIINGRHEILDIWSLRYYIAGTRCRCSTPRIPRTWTLSGWERIIGCDNHDAKDTDCPLRDELQSLHGI